MKPEPFRLQRSAYPFFRHVIARFSDMDAERHLNNVALASFYEDARVSFLRAMSGDAPAYRFVIAHVGISYLAEAQYPGEYDVGVGVSRFGKTSFEMGCALFAGDTCVGVCDSIQVAIGETGPMPLPPVLRVALEKKLLLRA
jgi:acyl-CoA thioester hydrolase